KLIGMAIKKASGTTPHANKGINTKFASGAKIPQAPNHALPKAPTAKDSATCVRHQNPCRPTYTNNKITPTAENDSQKLGSNALSGRNNKTRKQAQRKP